MTKLEELLKFSQTGIGEGDNIEELYSRLMEKARQLAKEEAAEQSQTPTEEAGLREAAIQAAHVLNSLMPKNPKSKKREWIWTIHNTLVKALSHSPKPAVDLDMEMKVIELEQALMKARHELRVVLKEQRKPPIVEADGEKGLF